MADRGAGARRAAHRRGVPGVGRGAGRLLGSGGGRLGLGVLALLVGAAILAPVIAPHDPLAIGADLPLDGPSRAHPFGTDELGRDVLSRIVFGARISLAVSMLSATLALGAAVPLGLLAGYRGGVTDVVIARLFDTVFAFPAVLLGVGVVAVLGTGLVNVVVAVAIISVPTLGRLTRAGVLRERAADYVEAARALGASGRRVVLRHILGNVARPLLVQAAVVMAEAVLLEAAFSFLGLGSRPPTPSWGTMLDDGRNYLGQAPWLGLFPGLAITVTVLGLNALSDALGRALAPSPA